MDVQFCEQRYEECAWRGLSARTHRPSRYANQLSEPVEAAMVAAKREKPTWGLARSANDQTVGNIPPTQHCPGTRTKADHYVVGVHPIAFGLLAAADFFIVEVLTWCRLVNLPRDLPNVG